ncbi:unnamed protein product [Psylliodes chrysocephalus]|uniref:Gamma-interferon-inducible lysosomal thiol reductase n=1 Tax=Psylliodes chrysocephalus TaxID=3402493 RepID=A0A9P0CEF3_9CUCU|nr:unnamed protein product [Psylliodes chrysocephala]
MFVSKVLLLIVGLSCISYSAQESQLKLVLYYEGLCPYCHDFIQEQLYPAYQALEGAFLIELIPLGWEVKTDDGWECQHGPDECFLNKVDACLISLKPPQLQLLGFINCNANSTSMELTVDETKDVVKQCAQENKLSWDDINKCVTDSGDALLLSYVDKQNKIDPPLPYVPHIRFNDIFDEDLEQSAREDLVSTVCGLLTGTKPSACN